MCLVRRLGTILIVPEGMHVCLLPFRGLWIMDMGTLSCPPTATQKRARSSERCAGGPVRAFYAAGVPAWVQTREHVIVAIVAHATIENGKGAPLTQPRPSVRHAAGDSWRLLLVGRFVTTSSNQQISTSAATAVMAAWLFCNSRALPGIGLRKCERSV